MEHPYQREASEHRKGRVPRLRRIIYDETSIDTIAASAAASSDAEGVTEQLKKTFAIIYKKHGSLKERRELNVRYRHVVRIYNINLRFILELILYDALHRDASNAKRGRSLARFELLPFSAAIAPLKKLRVLDLMDITEQQYDVLLAWHKQSLEDELLKPLREAVQMDQMSKVVEPPGSPSRSSSSDELGSPEAGSLQVGPISRPGENRSQVSRNEYPSHDLDITLADDGNASPDETRSTLPSKLASNPYPTAPYVSHVPAMSQWENKQQGLGQQEACGNSMALNHHALPPRSYHSTAPSRLPSASVLHRVPPSYYRGSEVDLCSSACDVSDAQPYGNPGQLTSVTNRNRVYYSIPYDRSSTHPPSQSLESYYSGGTPRYNTDGQANYDYHSLMSRRSDSLIDSTRAVQRSSSYPGPPEVAKPLLTRSWSAGVIDYAEQGAEACSPESFTQFEDVNLKASPPPSHTWEGGTADGAYSHPEQYSIGHMYQANSGTPS
ncbi:hypothetical protein C8R42DRAFT_640677 [Lentinula raphanica]|nr:hypothetical protein C8R42DRAFT_640677 [Lentinula raphanica]